MLSAKVNLNGSEDLRCYLHSEVVRHAHSITSRSDKKQTSLGWIVIGHDSFTLFYMLYIYSSRSRVQPTVIETMNKPYNILPMESITGFKVLYNSEFSVLVFYRRVKSDKIYCFLYSDSINGNNVERMYDNLSD
jgi:hypothetical protein